MDELLSLRRQLLRIERGDDDGNAPTRVIRTSEGSRATAWSDGTGSSKAAVADFRNLPGVCRQPLVPCEHVPHHVANHYCAGGTSKPRGAQNRGFLADAWGFATDATDNTLASSFESKPEPLLSRRPRHSAADADLPVVQHRSMTAQGGVRRPGLRRSLPGPQASQQNLRPAAAPVKPKTSSAHELLSVPTDTGSDLEAEVLFARTSAPKELPAVRPPSRDRARTAPDLSAPLLPGMQEEAPSSVEFTGAVGLDAPSNWKAQVPRTLRDTPPRHGTRHSLGAVVDRRPKSQPTLQATSFQPLALTAGLLASTLDSSQRVPPATSCDPLLGATDHGTRGQHKPLGLPLNPVVKRAPSVTAVPNDRDSDAGNFAGVVPVPHKRRSVAPMVAALTAKPFSNSTKIIADRVVAETDVLAATADVRGLIENVVILIGLRLGVCYRELWHRLRSKGS